MNLELIQLTIQGLAAKLASLEKRNEKLTKRIKKIENGTILSPFTDEPTVKDKDTLLDTKEVLKTLGICYNTLQAIIQKGLLRKKRINGHNVRFSEKEVLNYIQSLSN